MEKAKATYPAAKRRFEAGLPAGQAFYVVTRIRDSSGTTEQVFVSVAGIKEGKITGRIATDVIGLKGFKNGDPYVCPESEIIDWLITHPDGKEEGNVVGKFLDEWQKKRPRK